MDMINRAIIPSLPLFWDGFLMTLQLCAIGFLAGAALGMVLAAMTFIFGPVRWAATAFIEFFRATPIYVGLVWVAYVWPEVLGWPQSVYAAAAIALTLQTAAYLAETFRAGILAIAQGQREAAAALGMESWQISRRIVVPQVAINIIPSLMNQMVVVIKSSTVVSILGVQDLIYQANTIVNKWYEPFEVLTFVAMIYIVTISLLSYSIRRIEGNIRRRIS